MVAFIINALVAGWAGADTFVVTNAGAGRWHTFAMILLVCKHARTHTHLASYCLFITNYRMTQKTHQRLLPAGDSGPSTLRWAIAQSNNRPGRDRIEFALKDGHTTIFTTTPLPAVAAGGEIDIDASTQPRYDARAGPLVTVDGIRHWDTPAVGIHFLGGGGMLRALRVVNINGPGVSVSADGVLLQGNGE